MIEYSRAHFTGTPVARCTECDYLSVYWESPEDHDHDCPGNTAEQPTGRATCGHVDMLGALTGTPCGKCTRKRHKEATR